MGKRAELSPSDDSLKDYSGEPTESQEKILKGGTERAFSSSLLKEKRDGTYNCVKCGSKLFSSDTKFDSGTGWPSFSDVIKSPRDDSGEPKHSLKVGMNILGMGAEVKCAKCGGHLGHMFNDGPRPTGKRFCINGEVLKFAKK